jgi:hypothetical protein
MAKRSSRPGSNRALFVVIVGLAAAIVLCGLLTQSFGWTRICGSGILIVGAIWFLLANDRRWPAIVLLLGLALFFSDALLALLPAAPK